MTGNDYFKQRDLITDLDGRLVELALIDTNSSSAESALQDFVSLERHCAPTSVILIRATLPCDDEAAVGDGNSVTNGDGWKLIPLLRRHRPDLQIVELDHYPDVLGVVVNLDPTSPLNSVPPEGLDDVCEESALLECGNLTGRYGEIADVASKGFEQVEQLLVHDRLHVPISHISIVESNRITQHVLQGPKVCVLLPTIDRLRAIKTALILRERAGMECEIIIIDDKLRRGLVEIENEAVQHIDAQFFVYAAEDVFPSRNWLRIGYNHMEKTNASLLGFNDGKWEGHLASCGMVRSSWIKTVYGGPLFFPGYVSHAADVELTMIAMEQGRYTYNLSAILMEVDHYKDFKHVNRADMMLLHTRKQAGFGGRVQRPDILEWTPRSNVSYGHSAASSKLRRLRQFLRKTLH